MNKIKLLLLAGLIGLTIVSVALLSRNSRRGFNALLITSSLPKHVDMLLSGVNYTEVTSGKQEWTLEADTLRNFKAEKLMVFDRVKITFLTDQGLVLVTGDQARYYKKAKKIRITGRVRVEDSRGHRLTVRELNYGVKTGMLTTSDFFQVKGPKYDLEGQGFSVDVNKNRMTVLEKAKLLIKSAEKLL